MVIHKTNDLYNASRTSSAQFTRALYGGKSVSDYGNGTGSLSLRGSGKLRGVRADGIIIIPPNTPPG